MSGRSKPFVKLPSLEVERVTDAEYDVFISGEKVGRAFFEGQGWWNGHNKQPIFGMEGAAYDLFFARQHA